MGSVKNYETYCRNRKNMGIWLKIRNNDTFCIRKLAIALDYRSKSYYCNSILLGIGRKNNAVSTLFRQIQHSVYETTAAMAANKIIVTRVSADSADESLVR